MYIDPNTTIIILKDVPLDLTYDHTIWFPPNGQAAQAQYFERKEKYRLDRQSYQRVKRGWMRVNIKAENLYDCNYLMFRNTAFGEKWFYAFIKSVEYINHSVSEIEFQLDVMQTWYFDYTLEQSLVEREHQATDEIGDNLVPEGLELGDYVSDGLEPTGVMDGYSLVVSATFNKFYEDDGGGVYGDIYSGVAFNVFETTNAGIEQAARFIKEAKTFSDGIVNVFYAPTAFVTEAGQNEKHYTITKPKNLTDIDGYVPKNKKLFTYPYNFLYVTNLQGVGNAYQYEYFQTDDCVFDMSGTFTANPTCMLVPQRYKGMTHNYDELLLLEGFPQCAYNTDTFKAWLAQTALGIPFSLSGTGISEGAKIGIAEKAATVSNSATAAMGAELAPVLAGLSLATKAIDVLKEAVYHKYMPNHAHGTQSGSILAANKLLDFYFANKHIRAEFAQIIDEYFTMFGYACHRVKVPNTNVRPHWTYTKTVGCKIVSSMPADDAKTVCDIFDHGITFWVNGSEVGNYSLDNTPA